MEKHIKIFEEDAILVNRLHFLLDDNKIFSIIKNPIESGRLAGFGTMGKAVQLFILEKDIEKATPIINAFKKEIDS